MGSQAGSTIGAWITPGRPRRLVDPLAAATNLHQQNVRSARGARRRVAVQTDTAHCQRQVSALQHTPTPMFKPMLSRLCVESHIPRANSYSPPVHVLRPSRSGARTTILPTFTRTLVPNPSSPPSAPSGHHMAGKTHAPAFDAWCRSRGLTSMPATPDTVATFLAHEA